MEFARCRHQMGYYAFASGIPEEGSPPPSSPAGIFMRGTPGGSARCEMFALRCDPGLSCAVRSRSDRANHVLDKNTLIQSAAAGDPAALATLLQEHEPRLLEYVTRRLPNAVQSLAAPDDLV